MPTWSDLLDDYATAVASLEHRLDEDLWRHDAPAFEPPSVLPQEPPTPEDMQRFQHLQRRAEDLNRRLQDALDATRADLSQLDTRRDAAREYGFH